MKHDKYMKIKNGNLNKTTLKQEFSKINDLENLKRQ